MTAALDADNQPVDIRITPPPPGVAMLACRCGAVLDARDMWRQPIGCRTATIATITCRKCQL